MTCKDCVHSKVCRARTPKDEFTHCNHFKDKSKIIELPCKVGDVLYHFNASYGHCGRKRFKETIIEPATVDNFTIGELGIPQIEVCNENNDWTTYGANDFGKIVFYTKEEAEKVLEEMDNV